MAALFIDLNVFTDHACVLFTNREMKRLHGRAEDTRIFSTNTKRHLDATRINGCEERHTGPHCKLQDLRKQYRRISKCAKRGSEPAEFIQPIREGLESEEVRCPTVHATCSLSGSRERYEIPISQFEPKGL